MTAQTPYRVLARKYRPQLLSELLGQEALVKSLQKGLSDGRLPHAFVLHGIRGVGKTTTARIIAKSLNCADLQNGEPCGVCKSCVGIVEDRHLDVMEFDAASRTGVDDIREIIDSVRYKPVMGKFKIFIVDEVHMLSKSAFNALLKTLEEPPPHIKFIFATTEIRKIPDTILSRCMRFDLKRISVELLMSHLNDITGREEFTIDADALSYLARAADGSMRDGLSLLDQAIALVSADNTTHMTQNLVRGMLGVADRSLLFELLSSLFSGDVETALQLTQQLFSEGSDPILLLQDVMDLLYFVLSMRVSNQLKHDATWPKEDREHAQKLFEKLPLSQMMQAWQVLVKGYEEVKATPLQHQALEMVFMRLCFMANMPMLEDILSKNPTNAPQTNHDDFSSLGRRPAASPNASAGNTSQTHSFQGDASHNDTGQDNISQSAPSEKAPEKEPSHEAIQNANTTDTDTDKPVTLKTADDILEILQKNSPILASKIHHDVEFVAVSEPNLTVALRDGGDKAVIQQMGQVLQKITKKTWRIERVESQGFATKSESLTAEKTNKAIKAQDIPTIKTIVDAIPGTKVHVK